MGNHLLLVINASGNIFLFMSTGTQFRTTLLTMLRLRKQSATGSGNASRSKKGQKYEGRSIIITSNTYGGEPSYINRQRSETTLISNDKLEDEFGTQEFLNPLTDTNRRP